MDRATREPGQLAAAAVADDFESEELDELDEPEEESEAVLLDFSVPDEPLDSELPLGTLADFLPPSRLSVR